VKAHRGLRGRGSHIFYTVTDRLAIRLSALRAGRPLTPERIPGTHFCQKLSRPQDHSVAGKIMLIRKSNYLIGIRCCDLPTCSIAPQPTTLLRAIKSSSNRKETEREISVDNVVIRWKLIGLSLFHCTSHRFPRNIPSCGHQHNQQQHRRHLCVCVCT
jgi:hypothetical protein